MTPPKLDVPELCASGVRAAVQICREMGENDDLFGGAPIASRSRVFQDASPVALRSP